MTPKFGIDYAWGKPSIPALKAAKVAFVCRYLSHDPGKNLTGPEALSLHRAGLEIVTVWESTATRALDGHAAGVADAKAALDQLHQIGAPHGVPVFFAVDFDPGAHSYQTDAYFDGAASVLGKARVGMYGGYNAVSRHLYRGFLYAWQTYAWSGGKWHPRAHLRQYDNGKELAGVSCDFNQAVAPDYGQWKYVITRPAKKPNIAARIVRSLRLGGFSAPQSNQILADAKRGGLKTN